MFLKIKITCKCHCQYHICEAIDVEKVACPNCGIEHPFSAKLLAMLKTASEIPDGNIMDEGICTSVISLSEDMNNCL